MDDPMLIATRLTYGIREGHEQLDTYLAEAFGAYEQAMQAHRNAVRDASVHIGQASTDLERYVPMGLASITEHLLRSIEPFLDIDRALERGAWPQTRDR